MKTLYKGLMLAILSGSLLSYSQAPITRDPVRRTADIEWVASGPANHAQAKPKATSFVAAPLPWVLALHHQIFTAAYKSQHHRFLSIRTVLLLQIMIPHFSDLESFIG